MLPQCSGICRRKIMTAFFVIYLWPASSTHQTRAWIRTPDIGTLEKADPKFLTSVKQNTDPIFRGLNISKQVRNVLAQVKTVCNDKKMNCAC